MNAPNSDTQNSNSDDETLVRRYLMWIEDPKSMRDEAKVDRLREQIKTATDPIQKIHLASELHWAEQVDGSELRDGFISAAKRWAKANNIAPEAFIQLGVPGDDVRRAGFTVKGIRRSDSIGGRRAPRVSISTIREGAQSFTGPFTIADLRDRAGGSPATVRKALDELVKENLLENLGPDTDWSGPGRPPHRYENRSA